MQAAPRFDVIVVGGGPAAAAAHDLAREGVGVLLLDRAGRIKPCGGAIPPRAIRDFEIPDELLVAKARSARIVSPKDRRVDMPIQGTGFVGMVDREVFDEWLRARAATAGATRIAGTFETFARDPDGTVRIGYRPKGGDPEAPPVEVTARVVIGADGANSAVGRAAVPGADRMPFVFAYHEIIEAPEADGEVFDPDRCDVIYRGTFSPDLYAWVFPHGHTVSIGTGSANKGFPLRGAVAELRRTIGLDGQRTIRREGAPIPLKPLKRWDNGRDVILAGDAAGVVAPASGEGIYYAMLGGRLAALACRDFLGSSDVRALAGARRAFMRDHGTVFMVLRMMQFFWYRNDRLREHFVRICADPDVQRLTWDSYMNKRLARRDPLAHVRIFFKDLAHLFGLARA